MLNRKHNEGFQFGVTLHSLIKKYVEYTGSEHAGRILNDWEEMLPKFVKVFPIDYRKALERIRAGQLEESEVLTITDEVYDGQSHRLFRK